MRISSDCSLCKWTQMIEIKGHRSKVLMFKLYHPAMPTSRKTTAETDVLIAVTPKCSIWVYKKYQWKANCKQAVPEDMLLKIVLTLYQELSDCQILPLKRQELVQQPVLFVWFSQNKGLLHNGLRLVWLHMTRTQTMPEFLSRSLFLSPETHLPLVLVSGSSELDIFQ